MKRILLLAVIALCIYGCEKEKTYMSVANKTFYQEGIGPSVMIVYKFTNDSVFYSYGTSPASQKGTYTQMDDIVTFRFDGSFSKEHAFVKEDMLLWNGWVFVSEYPY